MSSLSTQITAAVASVAGDRAVLHEPSFDAVAEQNVLDCVRSGWVSSVGSYVDRFEQELAEYTGATRAVAVVNGTAALHLALVVAGVQANDEVLLPSLSFVATANAPSYLGAIPHFVDVEESTLGMDPAALDAYLSEIGERRDSGYFNRLTGRRISACVPMHCFGHPVRIDALARCCDKFGIALVEDAAESLGSFFAGRHTGLFGAVGAVSFNGNKILTTGGGGALLFDDAELADKAKHLSTTARSGKGWEFAHDQLGYNYRMPNINAALGCAQLANLPEFVERKRVLAARYESAFAEVGGATLMIEPENCCSNYWLQTVILDEAQVLERETVLKTLNDAGLMARPVWNLLHTLPMYVDCPAAELPVSQSLAERIINIPSSPGLVGG